MASTILSDNGVTSGSAGLKTTAASDGALALQTTTAGGTATTALTIDTSQNVGIGTTSPSVKLDVATTNGTAIYMRSTSAYSTTPYADLGFQYQYESGGTYTGGTAIRFSKVNATNNDYGSFMSFYTRANGGSSTEAMRISSSGQLLLGATSNGEGSLFQSSFTVLSVYRTDATGAYGSFAWYSDAGGTKTLRGYTMGNGGLANYSANNTNLSDERLKKDITLSGNYLDKICSIPVKNFRYKDQPETEDITLGVVAQDVQKVAPELVCNEGFGISEERENYLSVYQTDLQYALMKSIQELKAINDTQAETINALTARIVALEQA